MSDPLIDISVVKGTLQVSLGSWMNAGGWSISHRKFTFRHQDGCFKLIGYDATDVQRNTGKMSEISVNTAAELHECLGQTMQVRVTVVFAAGQLASKVEPDDEGTACVTFALDRAHFDDMSCTFEASVSSP